MANVQQREHSLGHVGESGIFELGNSVPGDELALASQLDPVLHAFGEVRSLNTQLQGANDALHAVNELGAGHRALGR